MTPSKRLQSVRIRNFKAIVDSKTVKLGALTAFIGNNGAGKSSLIEALETYQSIVRDGLDVAMQRWLGIEHARHKGQEARERRGAFVNPISFEISIGASQRKVRRIQLQANNDTAANRMLIAQELISFPDGTLLEFDHGDTSPYGGARSALSAPMKDTGLIRAAYTCSSRRSATP
jgi:predicted ATPase